MYEYDVLILVKFFFENGFIPVAKDTFNKVVTEDLTLSIRMLEDVIVVCITDEEDWGPIFMRDPEEVVELLTNKLKNFG